MTVYTSVGTPPICNSVSINLCCVNIETSLVDDLHMYYRYGLELIHLSGSIRHALSDLKTSHPQLKAVCMGTRHTDPYSGDLKPFSPTDGGWPDYMRINCILVSSYVVIQ